MKTNVYLVQTRLGYQLSAYPYEAGLDEEVSQDFLLNEETYRQLLNQLGGESVYLNEASDSWEPMTQSTKDPLWMVITYFKDLACAQEAAKALSLSL